MADRPRELVFCHECQNEWNRDEHGLTCPDCHSDFTEVVGERLPDVVPRSPSIQIEQGNDPRHAQADDPPYAQDLSSGAHHLQHHNPWTEDVGDPDEGDIDQLVHGSSPDGSMQFTRITYRSTPARGLGQGNMDPASMPVMNDFQRMIHGFLGQPGPGFAPSRPQATSPMALDAFGAPGRSVGPFSPALFPGAGPPRVAGQFTYTSGGQLWPRDANNAQPAVDPVGDLPG